MFLDEVGALLASSSVGVASSSGMGSYVLIKGHLPDSSQLPHRVLALVETPGGAPDAGDTNLDYPGLQVLVRGEPRNQASSCYSDARRKIQDARDTLHRLTPGSYGGRYYAGMWAQQEPFLLYFDEQARPVFGVNFLALRSRTS